MAKQKNKKDRNNESMIINLWHLFKDIHPKYSRLVFGLIFGSIATASGLFLPQAAGRVINDFSMITTRLIVVAVIVLVMNVVFNGLSGYSLSIFGEDVVAKLRKKLWDKFLRLPVSYYDHNKTGEINSRLINDTAQITTLLSDSLPNAMMNVFQFIGALVFMFMTDWRMSTLIIALVPIASVVIIPIIRKSEQLGKQRQDELANFSSKAVDVLSEVRLVKASNSENQEKSHGHTLIDGLFKVGSREAFLNAMMFPIANLLVMVMIFAVTGYGAVRVMSGTMAFGTLVSFFMYIFQIISPVAVITNLLNVMARTSGSTKRVQEMLKEKEEPLGKKKDFVVNDQILKLDDVSFQYEEDKEVLNHLTIEAKPNTVVAFAGPSGGGKTTIFSLIERFYQPLEGKILIGDQDIDELDLGKWRQQIGLVGQDASMMPISIRDNLTYGLDEDIPDEELWRVLKLAYADDFVKGMPDQLDTIVGERGTNLSGGQRQRLAIARAFLRDPKILMLDEATASLDAESEAMIQSALKTLMKGRMTLVIAHRLATIIDADQIYFIEYGHVTGSGKHEDLIRTTPLYAQYVKDQFKD